MVEGLSRYPIFIAHQHDLKLGEVILDRHDLNTEWSIHASTLEEFLERGVIKEILKGALYSIVQNPERFYVRVRNSARGANFIYYPYTK